MSIDQIISKQVGFIAKLKGKRTNRRNKSATIFVDHFSGLWYIHLMTNMTSEKTVMAQKAFKQFEERHGVNVQSDHCDNGCFFMDNCEQN